MLEIITGAMEAGKTWLLYKRISDAKLMGKNVQVFAFPVHEGLVVSRVGFQSKAITVPTIAEIESLLEPDVDTVAIDDAQLFEAQDLINFCNRYRKKHNIIIAGLQLKLPFYSVSARNAKNKQQLFLSASAIKNTPFPSQKRTPKLSCAKNFTLQYVGNVTSRLFNKN